MTATALLSQYPPITSLEDWLENPPERTEWVNGELFEKNGITLKHSKAQSRLSRQWANYIESSNQGGEVYTEVPCRTEKQGRSPDVAYLTPELVAEYGDAKALPRSFPLTAEIISPTDFAEDAIAKAEEYLQSGAEEVWLVFPENRWIIVVTQEHRQIFTSGDTVSTQKVITGFTIAVDDLLS
ncbi:Uma2 family endonuclease [Spirulina sp. CS-785/01]|uniref:Uma2 family endonuclease n=1 Tax=Spirulina sp. CS-785/01 TaxID=3021716 RepID=UPI00232B01E0|nr:Uma2 family endonuclease [Spirulina sp. CS-785/01]MDB9312976.1 Uma2 family endonuclease [Spirulina sp. CS-785/01]